MSLKSDKIVKEIIVTVAATVVLVSACWVWNHLFPHPRIHEAIVIGVISFEAGICFGKCQEFLKA